MKFSREEILKRADALYERREKLDNVKESVKLLRKLKGDYEALWRLSRAHFFLGQEAKTPDEKLKQHRVGVEAGKEIVRLKLEKGVEFYFWLGVNWALLAPLEPTLKAFFNARGSRHCFKAAIKCDKSYHAAGPLRVLARLESKFPFLLGGSKRRARKRYLEAIEIAPTNTVTRIYFAELLLELGEKEEARKHLETILQTELNGVWDFEIKRDKKLAQELLKKI
jgi:tetratricopeptide (TPR) repeat protein